jgi:heme/copper-type cytochrome/quinol oxidase subunit 1
MEMTGQSTPLKVECYDMTTALMLGVASVIAGAVVAAVLDVSHALR